MDASTPWLDALKLLAASEALPVEALGPDGLEDLLARGLVAKDDRPKQVSLEQRYEALQESHRFLLEARSLNERLQRRMAPRSRLVGLLSVNPPPRPGPEDPDVMALMDLLERLDIQVRGVRDLEQVPAHLDRIQEYILVESRECLDRMADTDRALDQVQKQAPPGTQVEPVGFFVLTEAGEAALPEAPVLEAFEAALQGAFGPLAHRSACASHLREDPASFLAYLLEAMARGERPSAVVSEYERLLEAFDRVALFSDLRSLRAKIAFLMRLLRGSREEPKRAYLWCNRERLQGLVQRIRGLIPASVAASGWHLPYAADLFLVDGGMTGEEAELEHRTRLYQAVQQVQTDLLQDVRIADGQVVRLGLTLTQAARGRNFAPGILMDRFLRQALETVMEASLAAPYDLGDRGTRLLFGAHLAHAAGFVKARLPEVLTRFQTLREAFLEAAEARSPLVLPVQAQLHTLATLDRLEQLGAPVPLPTYLGTLARLHKHLNHHKAVARAFRTDKALAGDEAALVANLAARVCFHGLEVEPDARRGPDAGLAGLYEGRDAALPPMLGSPFGTLMLS